MTDNKEFDTDYNFDPTLLQKNVPSYDEISNNDNDAPASRSPILEYDSS